MKKFYYYSDSKIKVIDLSKFQRWFVTIGAVCVLLFAVILYIAFQFYFSRSGDSAAFREENNRTRMNELSNKYAELKEEFDSLKTWNRNLRIAANFPDEAADSQEGNESKNSFFNIASGIGDLSAIERELNDLESGFSREKKEMENIRSTFVRNDRLYRCMPAIKPCAGVVLSRGFGMRYHPILHYVRMHDGQDITTAIGTSVQAPGDGMIEFAGDKGGYGNTMIINHGFGYQTLYGHLSGFAVRSGQNVKRGDIIAYTGNSGLSTGPHLHYEVWHNGVKVDPLDFFFDENILFSNYTAHEEKTP